eukprot:TRINITY_DN50561_c0_g1_i1.p1 TRINITY_DN50561_c0_g1~~TRINITY_DN50561_c0_g1_i1.p1  ORF type:complete len:147 (+),score=15.26 TRINITY_DN50561_c0_g1_i1:118-558(+)
MFESCDVNCADDMCTSSIAGRRAENSAPRVFDEVMKAVQPCIATVSKPAPSRRIIICAGSSQPETQFAQLSTVSDGSSEYQLSCVQRPRLFGTVPSSWKRSKSCNRPPGRRSAKAVARAFGLSKLRHREPFEMTKSYWPKCGFNDS